MSESLRQLSILLTVCQFNGKDIATGRGIFLCREELKKEAEHTIWCTPL